LPGSLCCVLELDNNNCRNGFRQINKPFAAKPSLDLLFIKLWAATLRTPEMEKACRKHQNGQNGIKE